ncbi:uncharacterized protein LOC133731307 [Rosa rugosa]|uniref:uncharacterized protein LOC133731307 n=1 Tax=Rosa rugosa TaxID=74645 RepID=UPI002B40C1E4|nr:uncharacterized protein LOC133731307 [Rosa rugosa]
MQSFKILTWNCRGLNNIETQDALVNIVRQRNPSIVFLSETLATPDLLNDIRRRIGFDGVLCSPREDDCRGLGLFWRNEIPLRLRNYSANHIDAEVGVVGSEGVFRFTGIYGVATTANRSITWNLLRTLAAQVHIPWLIAGDFNEILDLADKSGDPARSVHQMNRFRQALVDCGLMDMGFVGSRFTWANRFTKERLDRAFQNFQWRELYPFSPVITLPLSRSDHCPLLLETNPDRPPVRRPPRRFRFEEMWLSHADCENVVKTGWMVPTTGASMAQVGRKIKKTGNLILSWHEGVFQQRQVEMKLIQSKLDVIMRTDHQHSHFQEIRGLQFRLNELLSINETYWRQRSKVQWLREGDRNTSFFHRRASNRRSRNRVKGLMIEDGQWTSKPGEVENILLRYYETIFRAEQSDPVATASKVLANRLKKLLPSIISPLQSAFVPGRLISDNTLVATKVAHFMKKLRRQAEGFFSLKLDISKAYDRLELCYLEAILVKLGFCRAWVDVILASIKSVSYSILINGNPTGFILPTRGIRQGDPLSPYLFILCAEGLSALISSAVQTGTIRGLTMSPSAPTIHHLLFADDSFLFREASIRECQAFKNILSIYARASGQKNNLEKSSVVFSGNVGLQLRTHLASILGVKCVKEHGLYLGLPIHVGHEKTAIFAYLKERLTKKLISWRSKILSAGGKELLIKVVAQALPNYVMNCYLLPKSLCDDLQQLCAQFFWGSTDEKRKIHWRSWERMCIPKEHGGLGFKHLYAHNLAMLSKQGWRLLSNPNSLVAQVFKAVYYPNGSFLTANLGDRPSYSWRSILEARPVIQAGLFWRIGNGISVNIWEDEWIPNVAAHSIVRPSDTVFELVSDLIEVRTGSWDQATVHACFEVEIAMHVLSIPLSRRFGPDKIAWKYDKKGWFSVKSAYMVAREFSIGNVFAAPSAGDPYVQL